MTNELEAAEPREPADADGAAKSDPPKSDPPGADAPRVEPRVEEPRAKPTSRKSGSRDAVGDAQTLREWLDGHPLPPLASLFFGFVLPSMLLVGNLWRARAFTIDDAYISFRYARNFARGFGLVYNPGERIEGYTNFLWTVLLGIGFKIGLDPNSLAKVLGGGCAVGALYVTYRLAGELRGYRTMPCVATWFLASTIVFSGYAVFGLETPLFVLLVLGGIHLFLKETGGLMRGPRARETAPDPTAFPWSGVVLALAGLTRPEPPLFYVPVLIAFLGRRALGRQNLVRAGIVYGTFAAHTLFRRAYYGTWFVNTASAKTSFSTFFTDDGAEAMRQFENQLKAGSNYVQSYIGHQGPAMWLALLGLAIAIVLRRRDLLALATLAVVILSYVIVVGGDWMPYFRFMAPFEPLCFLLIDVGVRQAIDRRERATNLAFALFVVFVVPQRFTNLREAQNSFIGKEKAFWDKAAGGTATWLLQNGDPGEIAIGDIGFVGYKTDYPVLDLLGLVDPVIAKLPGNYTQKLGPGFRDRFFDVGPKYLLLISSNIDCQHPSVPGSQVLYRDARFRQNYDVAGKVPLDAGFAWCIYRNKSAPHDAAPPAASE